MKHIVRKPYLDYKKEEQWLNDMSARGLALSDYSWCRYVFADAPNGKYLYRIELLENTPNHPESQAYLRFLEENGVEHVASYIRWVYLRKNAADGPFDIYTDLDSKIRHYRRVTALWNSLMTIEWIIGGANMFLGIVNPENSSLGGRFSNGNFLIGCCLVALGSLFFFLGLPIRKKIRTLKKQKAITE